MFDPRDLADDPRTRTQAKPVPALDRGRKRADRRRSGYRAEYDPREGRTDIKTRMDRAVAEIGIYRSVAYKDMSEAHFDSHPYATRRAVDRMIQSGDVREQTVKGPGGTYKVMTLSRKGVERAECAARGQGLDKEQKAWSGIVKPGELEHDTAVFRAARIEPGNRRRGSLAWMRRLMSLDFVLEHPGLNWLSTEPEKVEFFKGMGIPSRLIPRRIYYGAVGAQKRYFALKLPVAGGADTVIFAYVDPGHTTAVELYSWGAAHGPLWDAVRAGGRRVEIVAIGAELDTVMRADRVLQLWASAEPGKAATGLTVKQEMALLKDGLTRRDMEFLAAYGGEMKAAARYVELQKLPEADLTEGVSIDGFSTYRATRFADPV